MLQNKIKKIKIEKTKPKEFAIFEVQLQKKTQEYELNESFVPLMFDSSEENEDFIFEPIPEEKKRVLILVHGYCCKRMEFIEQISQFLSKLHYPGDIRVFIWPSKGELLAYSSDVECAQTIGVSLLRLLLMNSSKEYGEIDLLGHSLGCRVIMTTVGVSLPHELSTLKLRNIVLGAPDISQHIFEVFLPKILQKLRNRITIYVNKDDFALGLSNFIYNFSLRKAEKRLGQTNCLSEGIDSQRVDIIDTTKFKLNFCDSHSYMFAHLSCIFDLSQFFNTQLPAIFRYLPTQSGNCFLLEPKIKLESKRKLFRSQPVEKYTQAIIHEPSQKLISISMLVSEDEKFPLTKSQCTGVAYLTSFDHQTYYSQGYHSQEAQNILHNSF